MATIDSKEVVDEIIAGDGYYLADLSDDSRVVKIVRYTNAWGGISFGLIWEGQPLDLYRETQFVRNPTTLWEVAK